MATATTSSLVEQVRAFNRFYTREIGVLRDSFLDAGLSLSEMRVLYEIAHAEGITASAIAKNLRMDPGYLSRLLRTLHGKKLVSRRRSEADSRQAILELTKRGAQQFAKHNQRQNEEVANMLEPVSAADQKAM